MSFLPRIVLFVLQLAGAWYLAPPIKRALPAILASPYDIFVYALLYAVIVTLIGHAGALVLKEVKAPSGATLVASLVLALVLAGLTLVPVVTQAIEQVVPALRGSRHVYPLVGAVVGYFLRR